MREQSNPSNIQLKELYEAAVDFKKAEPWEYLYDADIICVENPADGSIGYCSVMGKGGEHFALGVYLGDGGIYGFSNMMNDADKIPAHQMPIPTLKKQYTGYPSTKIKWKQGVTLEIKT